MKKFTLLFSLATLAGCSVSNQVETLIPENAVVKNKTTEGYTDRFKNIYDDFKEYPVCLLYTSPSPRDRQKSRMPSSA